MNRTHRKGKAADGLNTLHSLHLLTWVMLSKIKLSIRGKATFAIKIRQSKKPIINTSNICSKCWNSCNLVWNPSASAPPVKQQTIRETAVPHRRDCILNIFIGFYSVFLCLRKSRSSYTPPSGIPWAFCLLALRTSFAETKKMRFLASTGSITLSSSTRKVRQRSMCCLRT